MIRLAALTDGEIETVHQATLRILSEIGIVLAQPDALSLLLDAGAKGHNGRVLLPVDLVEQAVAQCPGAITLHGRDGKTITLGDGTLHWHNLGGAPNVYEPEADQCRSATVQDVRDSTRLLDALDGATAITPLFTPQDVPGELMSLAMYRHTLPHTTKPVHGPGVQTAAEVRYLARMAEVIGDPREVLTIGISPLSPLTFPDDVVEAILETAQLGIPLGPLPCPTVGATSPMSLAGSLAQQNAEVLASVALAQLVRPGLPIFYCGRLATMNPFTGGSVWGTPEVGLVSAATVQVAHRYGLPVNVYGLCSSARAIDAQNGYERVLNAILPALAGADELSGIGEAEGGLASSYAQIVYDNEIAARVYRLRRGFVVDPETLAVEIIAEVMDGPRNFLAEPHTVKYMRAGEVLHPSHAEQRLWAEEGIAKWSHDRAKQLLTEHEVLPLEEMQTQELDAIMRAADRKA